MIDSQDMASHLDKLTISANEVFVLLDIVSLYPNINTKHLIECMNEDPDIENITTEMTDFILGHAFFEYQEKCFQQISGIPMGTNCAVSLANWYLSKILDPLINQDPRIRAYKRYIDDLFFIYTGTRSQLFFLTQSLQHHTKLRFTSVYEQNSITMLDLAIERNLMGNISYKTYHKPMNQFAYLPKAHIIPLISKKAGFSVNLQDTREQIQLNWTTT